MDTLILAQSLPPHEPGGVPGPPAAPRWRRPHKLPHNPRMPVDPALLEILVCPACKTPVRLVNNDTALRCDTCRRVYPIKDDIPVMLIDEATRDA